MNIGDKVMSRRGGELSGGYPVVDGYTVIKVEEVTGDLMVRVRYQMVGGTTNGNVCNGIPVIVPSYRWAMAEEVVLCELVTE